MIFGIVSPITEPLTLVTFATVCFARQSFAQGTLEPLFLFPTGDGSITPLQNGQLLEVGQMIFDQWPVTVEKG